ncbi:DUF1190 domain-containing protein [Pararoseomonas sp. SCSIO 73927]|uniref:DUF1190 domain-containing protein n=1 Tax=Pararoseomonas sp. SCSIO 73927 TaxID=3114537 RepID=UPI0030D2BAB1
MRRSSKIALTLVVGAGLGAGAFAALSGNSDEEGVLTSEAACVERLGGNAAAECGEVFRSAVYEHARTAPRYASAEECQQATGGDCTGIGGSKSAGATAASLFIPAMAGVMIGRMMADGTRGAMPVYAGAAPPPGACPPGVAGQPGCPPAQSSRGSGTSSGGGGRAYWYSGTSYAGTSEAAGRGGFRAASATTEGGTMLARSAGTASGTSAYYGGRTASRSGGLGFSASAHSSSGS